MNMQWSDFNLNGCAQSEDDARFEGFQEYPILGASAWLGGSVKAGNDRVVFQVVDDKTAAFCGIIRHPGKDGVDKHFQMCDDPAGTTAVAPYEQGTCSLHLTQWDYVVFRGDGPRYDVEITIFDNAKNQIGYQSRTGCDGSNLVSVPSALEDDLKRLGGVPERLHRFRLGCTELAEQWRFWAWRYSKPVQCWWLGR